MNDFISFSNVGTYATDGDPAHGHQNATWSGSFNITFDPTLFSGVERSMWLQNGALSGPPHSP
jgi:hypothetical protein